MYSTAITREQNGWARDVDGPREDSSALVPLILGHSVESGVEDCNHLGNTGPESPVKYDNAGAWNSSNSPGSNIERGHDSRKHDERAASERGVDYDAGEDLALMTLPPEKSCTSNKNSSASGVLDLSAATTNAQQPPLSPDELNRPPARVFTKKSKDDTLGYIPIPHSRMKMSRDAPSRLEKAAGSGSSTGRHENPGKESWEMSTWAPGRASPGSDEVPPPLPSSPLRDSLYLGPDHEEYPQTDSSGAAYCPYLTPIDSPPPSIGEVAPRFSFPDKPGKSRAGTSFRDERLSESSNLSPPPYRHHGKEQSHERADSGMGDSGSESDFRRCRTTSEVPSSILSGASSVTSASFPRMSTHYEQQYEDIDHYRRHDDVPEARKHSTAKDRPSDASLQQNGLRPLPPININGVTHSESEDSEVISTNPDSRAPLQRLAAPAPEALEAPHAYTPLQMNGYVVTRGGTTKGNSSGSTGLGRGGCCCLTLLLLLLFLMSAAALGLSVYLLLDGNDQDVQSTQTSGSGPIASNTSTAPLPQDVEKIIAELRSDIGRLREENSALMSEMESIKSSSTIEAKAQAQLHSDVEHLLLQQYSTLISLTNLETKVASEMANISLTPGPQGPPGLLNYTQCISRSTSNSAVAHATIPTMSAELPSSSEIQDYFLMFAYCHKQGATDVHLEMLQVPDQHSSYRQYKCVCSGQISGQSRTVCTIHAILCPR